MSKRNVSFIKPEEPSFLKKLKKEIGFKEGPTVDTKREKLPDFIEDDEEKLEEQPVVVVLKPGDLTATEAESEKKKLKAEEEAKPADLNQKVVFRPSTIRTAAASENSEKPNSKSRAKDTGKPKVKLSFNEDEEDEEN